MKLLLLLFVGYLVCLNQVFALSSCAKPAFENLTVENNFDLNRFLGVWFEIQWLPGEPHNESDIWRNYYQSFQIDSSSSSKLLVPGQARVLNNNTCFHFGPWTILANNSAKMLLETKSPSASQPLNWPYYILKTDYENYALIYGCITPNYDYKTPCSDRILWVFARTTSLSNDHMQMLDKFIENDLCVNLNDLEITPHDGQQCYLSSSINLNFNILFLVILFFLSI